MNFLRIRKVISLISVSVMLLLTIIICGGCGGDLKTIPKRDLKEHYGSEMLTALLDEYKDIINIKFIYDNKYVDESNEYRCKIKIIKDMSKEEAVAKAYEMSKYVEEYINSHPKDDINFSFNIDMVFYQGNPHFGIHFYNFDYYPKNSRENRIELTDKFKYAKTFNYCNFSDLKPLKDIEYIDCDIYIQSVDELDILRDMKNLKYLSLHGAWNKEECISKCKEILPNCEIAFGN